MAIEIKTVENKSDLRKFVKSQWNFYQNDENFVPPVIADRMKLLNEKKNPFFQHAKIKHFLAYDGNNIIGRISAIINGNHNKTHNDKVGFFGFFECANNQEAANFLFESAEKWLKEHGIETMRGPMNPSQNDEIGLLIDGFDSPPMILMTYNPKYYIDLIEGYGLSKAKDIYAYLVLKEDYLTPKLKRMQSIVRKRYNMKIREVNFKDKEQFRKDVDTLKYIYNEAWEPNWGFVKMTDAEFDFLAEDLKTIANPKLTFIVEIEGKPAGFHLGLPDINQCLIHNRNGSLLGAAWHLLTKRKKINQMRIIVLGVIPKYQKTGVDAVMYYESGIRGAELGIEVGEASWVLEDNIMMNRGLTETMNGRLYKKYRIFEKKID